MQQITHSAVSCVLRQWRSLGQRSSLYWSIISEVCYINHHPGLKVCLIQATHTLHELEHNCLLLLCLGGGLEPQLNSSRFISSLLCRGSGFIQFPSVSTKTQSAPMLLFIGVIGCGSVPSTNNQGQIFAIKHFSFKSFLI